MVRRSCLITASLTLSLVPALALAQAPGTVSLARSDKWEVNYDENSCQLFGRFGSDDNAVILNIKSYQPGDSFDIYLYGKAVRIDGAVRSSASIAFGEQQLNTRQVYAGTGGNGLPLIIFHSQRLDGWTRSSKVDWKAEPPKVPATTEAAITSLTVQAGAGPRLRLETGSLGVPMEAIHACLSDLTASWGYDPKVQESLSRRVQPTGSPASWVRLSDNPRGTTISGHDGVFDFRLDVDETGKSTACHILHQTNPADLADFSCRMLVRNAKFKPALDAQGKAVKSFYVSRIAWLTLED